MIGINEVPLLTRREIEARIAGPLIRAFAEEFGKEKTCEIVGRVISGLAKEAGRGLASMVEHNDIESFIEKLLPIFKKDALEIEALEVSPERAVWDTTRCLYAEMYKRIGMEDIGVLLSCARDGYLFEGYNPDIVFERSKTVMEGQGVCDFCLEMPNGKKQEK